MRATRAGVEDLIEAMGVLATGPWGSVSANVQEMAREVTKGADSDQAVAQALEDWAYARTGFEPNPVAETLTNPDQMILDIAKYGSCRGDADEVAALIAAMGLSLGLDARFVVIAFHGRNGFTHVFTELKASQDPWSDDPVAPKSFADRVSKWSVFPIEKK